MKIPITHGQVPQAITHYCDCRKPAFHRFGGWECQACYDKRKALENWDREQLAARVRMLQDLGLAQIDIAKRLGIGRMRVHRIVHRERAT